MRSCTSGRGALWIVALMACAVFAAGTLGAGSPPDDPSAPCIAAQDMRTPSDAGGVVFEAPAGTTPVTTTAAAVYVGRVYLPHLLRPSMPTVTRTPTPTRTPTRTATPSRTPTPSATATTAPLGWLGYLNAYRAQADLPPVAENATWSNDCWLHARYMVKNDVISHSEEATKPWYTAEGDQAARFSNLAVSSDTRTSYEHAIDMWMAGPFHAIGMIDPSLWQSAFGSYREADGGWQWAAALDVIRGLGPVPATVGFPVKYPAEGRLHFLRAFSGGEWPDPLSCCPGYSMPSGPPIMLQLGAGDVTPIVTAHSFRRGNTLLEHCIYDETTYTNPDAATQGLARQILGARDAVVLFPRQPLERGVTYTVSITANGIAHSWSFTVAPTAGGLSSSEEGMAVWRDWER